ncbi:transcription factor domain-containing protein [Aspergillus stella-maris]|uniref:transcription factor domain-containing protein n=1 Tax=Aspergillus stella-maris TaxID=1810926 RepID=UPI003CCE0867
MDTPRRSRNRAACKRCQRRKIRCDGHVPSCGSCRKAGVECVNDGMQEVHRSYIVSRENRIRWLESIIRDRCSDIDLDHGSREPPENEDTTMLDEASGNQVQGDPPPPLDHDQGRDYVTERAAQTESPRIVISQEHNQPVPQHEEPQQAHEIGLLSLSPGGDPRYIGPSSGFFFAKRILNNAGCRMPRASATVTTTSESARLSFELLNTPAALPTQKQSAVDLSAKYFKTVHILYPFLHEQMHSDAIDRVYASQEKNPLETFQVYMVLAIASLNLSRQCKVHLPVEGYYSSAMKHVDYVCNHGSVVSLQCLLLLMVYALYNPSCNVNIWNLNYQCLASVVDLGLQRDVRSTPSLRVSVFDQEMRARIFWVVYALDRTVCTMMGRPIGIRDEAFDIGFPQIISDRDLINVDQGRQTSESSHISFSIHLFRLARLNSEIKYIMHSVNREAPAYALPAVRNILTWQQDMMASLDNWLRTIPQQSSVTGKDIISLCKAKYHETMILLLRPSPGIPNPTDEILDECFNHALSLIQEYSELYGSGNLLYSRLIVHSIFLGTLVMLNCIWKLPLTAARIPVDDLISKLNASQNILSSIGEHWLEATRARDCIRELSSATVQRLLKMPASGSAQTLQITAPIRQSYEQRREHDRTQQYYVDNAEPAVEGQNVSMEGWPSGEQAGFEPNASEFSNLFDDFLQGDFPGWSGMSDIDGLMWEIFNSAPP